MSLERYRRRREVLLTVLQHARRNPDGPIPFERVPHATEVFADRRELLAALHHRWMLLLTARLELATAESDDQVEAVARAWRRLAADERVLRRLLEAHNGDLPTDALRAEHRMLALWSGLAEPSESADEVARIGAAFAGLLRSPAPARRPLAPLG